MQKHQGSSHRFIHQVLKNGKDLSQWYYEYAMHAAKQYRQETSPDIDNGTGVASAGDFTGHLSTLVSSLGTCSILAQPAQPLIIEILTVTLYFLTICLIIIDGESYTNFGA